MLYCHGVLSDQDFLDNKSQDLLTIQHIETLSGLADTGEEVVYPIDKLEVGLLINRPRFYGLQFRHQCRISFPQSGYTTAKLRKLHKPFLVCIEQPVNSILYTDNLFGKCFFSHPCRTGMSSLLDSSVYLPANEVRVFK